LPGGIGPAGRFVPLLLGVDEGADFREAGGEKASGRRRRKDGKTEKIVERALVQRLDDIAKHLDRRLAFTSAQPGARHEEIGRKLEPAIAKAAFKLWGWKEKDSGGKK